MTDEHKMNAKPWKAAWIVISLVGSLTYLLVMPHFGAPYGRPSGYGFGGAVMLFHLPMPAFVIYESHHMFDAWSRGSSGAAVITVFFVANAACWLIVVFGPAFVRLEWLPFAIVIGMACAFYLNIVTFWWVAITSSA